MGTGSFPGVKRPGRGVDHIFPPSAKVEGRVELYLYFPSGSLWPILGRTLSGFTGVVHISLVLLEYYNRVILIMTNLWLKEVHVTVMNEA